MPKWLTWFQKWNTIWKWRHHSKKTKDKLSKMFKWRKVSEETRKKIRENSNHDRLWVHIWENKEHPRGMLWKKHSKETIKKMGQSHSWKKFTTEHRQKLSDANKWEKCYNWQWWITPKNNQIRTWIEYRLWRESVFSRDNWTCQKCLKRSKKSFAVFLHPHHILNFSSSPELRFDINNWITFCKECHHDFHVIFSEKNNTLEQVIEFINK